MTALLENLSLEDLKPSTEEPTTEEIATEEIATEEIAPKVKDIQFNDLSSCEDTLGRATKLSLGEIKKIHEDIKKGETVTISKDCQLSRDEGTRIWRLKLADKEMKAGLVIASTEDFPYRIKTPKLPKPSKHNRGKQYEARISLFANMLRSLRDLHPIREITISNQAKNLSEITTLSVVIDYKCSVEHIALLVSKCISSDVKTQYVLVQRLCTEFGGFSPEEVEIEDAVKLGRVHTLKTSL